MSDVEATAETSTPSLQSIFERLQRWYQVPSLLLIIGFMLWVRSQAWSRFIRGPTVYFTGNDPWYHFRMVEYAVSNSFQLQPYEIWTGFSYGTNSGQFGTLFDQIIGVGALIVGLGNPSTQQIATSVLFAPAVFGSLVAIPTYLIARKFGGRIEAVFASVTLALLPGLFLQRGLVGSADHNVAEPLFQSFAVAALAISVYVAERNRPVWEQFLDRDYLGLREVAGWGIIAGIATSLYLWMWPPGVLMIGISVMK